MLRSTQSCCHSDVTCRMAATLAIGTLTLFVFSPPASAQATFNEERVEISPFAGATLFHRSTAGIGSQLETGPLFGGRITVNLTQHFALEGSAGYDRTAFQILGAFPNNLNILQPKFETRTFNFNGDAVYHFTPLGSRWRPFVDIGFGGVRFLPTTDAKDYYSQNFATSFFPAMTSVSRVQYNMGGGLKLRLNNWFGLRADARFVLSRYPTFSINIPQDQWLEGTEITGGLVFYIGGKSGPIHKIDVAPIVATPAQGDAGLTAGNPAGLGTGFRLSENAKDTLGHNLNYHWTVDGMPVGENSASIMYTPAQAGQFKVSVQVSDTAPKNPAPAASPDPVTLYVADHRITMGPISINPATSAANPAPNGTGFGFSVTAQDSLGHPLTYRWTVDGTTIPGSGNSVTFTESQPGQHNVGVQATDGTLTASAAGASFYTATRQAPTASCNAAPGAVTVGETSTLSVTTRVAPGSNARIQWTVSEGTISNATAAQTTFNSTSVSFQPSGQVQTKTITATATVRDDSGGTVSCTSTIRVSTNPQTTHYGDIVFAEGSARINNCAKRVLIERVYPQLTGAYAGYTVVLVGHVDPSESGNRTLDRRRVMNAAAVLTAGKDTCTALEPSRITADWVGTTETEYKDTPCSVSFEAAPTERPGDRVNPSDARAKNRRVEIWLVPPGKSLPSSVKEAHVLPTPELQRLACPK
jgi:outer membrane protein OmpA-like peptidoglycan-associated protein